MSSCDDRFTNWRKRMRGEAARVILAGSVGPLALALCLVWPSTTQAVERDETLKSANIFGDLRVRGEFDRKPNLRDRWRPRLRLRLGGTFPLGEQLRVGVRLTTGNPSDPRSPHQTYGSGGGKFTISLDRAFLDYLPKYVPGDFQLTLGKFGHRLVRPTVYGELLLDEDTQPSGILATWASPTDTKLELAAGDYLVSESSSGDDTHSVVGQVAVRHKSENGLEVVIAADAFLLFIGDDTVDALGHPTGRGNLVVDERFVSDFRIVQGFTNVTVPVANKPLTVSGGYAVNAEAATSDDTLWYVGANLGKVSRAKNWSLFAQYQQVEQEAVFTPWSQDDFSEDTRRFPDDRGSNFNGFLGGARVGIRDNVTLRLWTLVSSLLDVPAGENDDWVARFRLDLDMRF